MGRRRVLAFRHKSGEDLGTIRPALESRGVEIQWVDLFAGGDLPDTTTANGLLFMGGSMGANDELPFLARELELIRMAAARRQPVLGVCLGAQLISRALGGKVYKSTVSEIGWYPIQFETAAAQDPLMGTLPPDPDVFQWHSDTFDLPPGATLLARSEACRQAFRCGDSVYGVQFHPEMTDRLIEEWRVEGQRPLFAEPPGACGRLAELCDRTIAGWSGLL